MLHAYFVDIVNYFLSDMNYRLRIIIMNAICVKYGLGRRIGTLQNLICLAKISVLQGSYCR
jgi:hypothetical protein